jgi:capsular polysaccharide biosynthesis protein
MNVPSPVFQLINQNKMNLLIIVGSVTLLALVISLFLPKEYLSQSSILPANSKMMDKQRLFGENIQELYSAYGNSEDLDRLYATMRSGAVLNAVADSFNLIKHYDLEKTDNARSISYRKLQKNIELLKTEYGEIRISVWDKDAGISASIANAIVARTREVSEKMFTGFYEQSIDRMEIELSRKTAILRSLGDSSVDEKKELESETTVIRSRMTEYRVTQLNPPPSLFILEKAAPSSIPDKPNVLLNIIISFLVASVSSVLWLALKHARKSP